MNRLILLISFLLTFTEVFSQNKLIIQDDYKISIPKNWLPLSKKLIVELQKNNTPDLRSYIIGFSSSDSNTIDYPYFTANYNEIPGSENALFITAINIQKDILQKSGFDGEFVIDSSNYNFYAEQKLNDITLFRGYSVGGNGILYLNYYSDSSNSEVNKLQFIKILNSIQHNIKFSNKNNYLEEANHHKKKSGQHALIAIIALGLLLLLYFIRRKKE